MTLLAPLFPDSALEWLELWVLGSQILVWVGTRLLLLLGSWTIASILAFHIAPWLTREEIRPARAGRESSPRLALLSGQSQGGSFKR